MLKFISFQQMYFDDSFPPEFEVSPRDELKNIPLKINAEKGEGDYNLFIRDVADKIADILDLKEVKRG